MGLGINKLLEFVPEFRSDSVDLIEQNRRHSSTMSRVLRLRIFRRWSEAGIRKR